MRDTAHTGGKVLPVLCTNLMPKAKGNPGFLSLHLLDLEVCLVPPGSISSLVMGHTRSGVCKGERQQKELSPI